MLKKVLNNPWFVVMLCSVATVYLGFSIGKPLLESNASGSSGGVDVPPLDLANAFESADVRTPLQGSRTGRHSIGGLSGITWLDDIQRDPFASSIDKPRTTDRSKARPSARTLRLPTLTAVFVGRGNSSAVLDDRLVRVGDTVQGFEVSKIQSDRVILARGSRTFTLEPGA